MIGYQNVQGVQRQNIYIACEEIDMVWDERDVSQFDLMWNEGMPLSGIAACFNRPYHDLWLLMIDRFEKEAIDDRPGGIWGNAAKEVANEEIKLAISHVGATL